MLRNLWFQLHWLIGITFGLVIAVVGFTGGILSYEQPIIRLLNPGVMTVAVPTAANALSPQQLLAQLQQQLPHKSVAALGLSSDPEAAVAVSFIGGKRGETLYANPYNGEITGQAQGRGFMSWMRKLHRWLLLDIDIGRPIVGIATALLILLAFSGIYLRWPKKVGSLRAWLTLDWRQKGRSFLWHLHAVVGTWVFLFYLLASGTGLWWSFDWYRAGLYSLAGVEQPQRRGPPGGAEQKPGDALSAADYPLDRIWQQFTTANAFQEARLTLPQTRSDKLSIRYLPSDAPHDRASDTLLIDPASGKLIKATRYSDKRVGEQFMASIFPLHAGSFFGPIGTFLMMLASLAMPLFFISGWMLYLKRRRNNRAGRALRKSLGAPTTSGDAVLVAYASQSGSAERFAWQSAGHLQAAGLPVSVRSLNSLKPHDLKDFSHALFALATFGDGQAPDNARAFAKRMASERPTLAHLKFGLLALGDKTYAHFCGFGKSVGDWLHAQGATPLFEAVHLDIGDRAALANWRHHLNEFAGTQHHWQEATYDTWTLLARTRLNPGSSGAPIHLLSLVPAAGVALDWQAGDLVEVPVSDADGHISSRDYSIASVPADGCIRLLVREARHADGRLGLGSALLLEQLALNGELPLRLRQNRSFHAPDTAAPMILIGNGSGIAGLMSHLRERELAGLHDNWLLFGERQRNCDFYFRAELEAWLADAHLTHLDLAFSRDQADKRYVQHCLREQRERLHDWIERGAAVYVCGSIEGMAPAVEEVLVETLGRNGFDALLAAGRYRRDVY